MLNILSTKKEKRLQLMRNNDSILICFFLFFMLNFCFAGYSQKSLSYKADNQPLNAVLTKVSTLASVRFAFDNDYFSKISVSINVKGVSVEEFLEKLSSKYPIGYRLIGSTWVVYKDEKIAVAKTKPKVEENGKQLEPSPVKSKIEPKISRLWDFKGIIIDARTGNRLKYSKIYVDEYTQPETNDQFFFSDEVVGNGEVRAYINHISYYPLDTVFKIIEGEDITIKLIPILKPGITDDESFSEYPICLHNQINSISVYNRNSVIRGGKEPTDFANSFQLIPGITLSTINNNGIEIRGGTHSVNNILLMKFLFSI
jgi:hypothetical protein